MFTIVNKDDELIEWGTETKLGCLPYVYPDWYEINIDGFVDFYAGV
jgi:hypothetical protein